MTVEQAKGILLLYRPGIDDDAQPELAAALKLASEHAELGQWLRDHRGFNDAVRTKLRQLSPPPYLKARLLAAHMPAPPLRTENRWRLPWWLAAAAAAVVLALALAWATLTPSRPDRFVNFQERMVSTALRGYNMDIATNDMAQVRRYLASHGAPADYEVPRGLERLQLTGGAALRWRSNPVSMVCFNRGDHQMAFLFVTPQTALKDPPPGRPTRARINEFETVSWSRGDKTYVLAGAAGKDFPGKYLE